MTHRKTNISNLDDFLEGGLKKNTITLFSAHPGVENSPFAYHIMNQSLKEGESVVYVTNTKGINAVEEDMRCHGMNVQEYKNNGRFIFVDAYSGLVKKSTTERFHPENPREIESLTKTLGEALKTARDDHTLVVYDSISTLVDQSGTGALKAFANWKKMFTENNATGIFMFTEWPYEEDVLAKVRQASDAVIQLSATEKKVILQKYLTVLKANWTNKIKNEFKLPFNVMQEGLVIPETKDIRIT